MELIIASNNAHKVQEIRQILGDRFTIFTMQQKGLQIEVEETGLTLYDNALLKAQAVSRLSGCIALADDTGLFVDALDGQPGIHAARYAGIEHDDKANRAKLLRELAPWQSPEQRTARFCCVSLLYYPDDRIVWAQGRVEGRILTQEIGDNGFGYDSLFWVTQLGKAFAQCSAQEKNSVSHRRRSLEKLVQQLDALS